MSLDDLKYWDGMTYDDMAAVERKREQIRKETFGICDHCHGSAKQYVMTFGNGTSYGVDCNCHLLVVGFGIFKEGSIRSIPTEPFTSGEKCEACGKSKVTVIVSDADQTPGDGTGYPCKDYHLCSDCHRRLVVCHLTKRQWKNLIANGHSEHEFYLHEDFYDENGRALQPHD